MNTSACDVFDFLDRHESGMIHRHEISWIPFDQVRQSLRRIVFQLNESDEGQDLSEQLRVLLSEWLTTPAPFSTARRAIAQVLGPADSFRVRWGPEMSSEYNFAIIAAQKLETETHPLREKVRALVHEFQTTGRDFRIFCHSRAKTYFQNLMDHASDSVLAEARFLHSVRNYRDCRPFEVLLKVGPLRSGGWGAVPDAIVTAPRFNLLEQVVWRGSFDEDGFGYDPALLAAPSREVGETQELNGGLNRGWETKVFPSGNFEPNVNKIATGGMVEIDELSAFRDMRQRTDARVAVLVQTSDDQGVLFAPHSRILSFDADPAVVHPMGHRSIGDSLTEGMYLIMPAIEDVDLGGTRAEHGHYSLIWKDRLARTWASNRASLTWRLQQAGLKLEHIESAVHRWCMPPSTVIHAPQRIEHFKSLLNAIKLGDEEYEIEGRQVSLASLAWDEIRKSRSKAIQAGFQEHDLVENELLKSLTLILPTIRANARVDRQFSVEIPRDCGLSGSVRFFAIQSIELGFRAPDLDLKRLLPLKRIDRWRA